MIFDSLGSGLANITAARHTEPDDLYPATGGGLFGLTIRRPIAGVPINRDSALTYSAVWACCELITKHLAMMPWRVMKRTGKARSIATDHPADAILYRIANDETNSYEFRKSLVLSALLQGNGLSEIERNRFGEPVSFWGIDWDRVNPDRDNRGRLIYDIAETGQPNTVLKPSDVIHLRGGPSVDGISGLSVIQYAKECFSHGLAMEQFGSGFFGNGAMPGGVIEWKDEAVQPEGWGSTSARNMKKTWLNSHRGAKNHGGVEILEPGQTYKAIAISPENAQFLESRQFGIAEVCRWFGVPPHKVAELSRSTNNNIESQNIEYVTDTLSPWAVRLEQEVDFKLFGRDTSHYNRINLGGLLRGDMAARQAFYQSMMDRGVYSIDEVRALEDLNPLDNDLGKLRMVQMNMATVEQANATGNTSTPTGATHAG
ncbi:MULTISPECIES: phage portal protein [unclassified Oceanobacter]|uniref:phage portal protein n=1 Tax=unclassified Oceanobacter TaxID=2620260 RepID=UPI002734E573|nr:MULTISPECIES: phage portal protein [unclassified Oceanobacter]MDP2610033.1 phage portal protein [Oceanobacter sp. 1_MG-2023]MDP2613331.1 phage portal protein [Oceanobacter sp. 2_MG-2023]